MRALVVTLILAIPSVAAAQRWQDATADCLGTTAEWSNKIDVADVDGDGQIDILVANGGDYASPGTPEPTRIWRNLGTWAAPGAHCQEISAQAVGGLVGLARTIRAADVDGDGDLDLFTGGAWHTQARLYLRDGTGWRDATAQLPQQATSIGDAQLGDVDGDGDLDLVIADGGAEDPGDAGYAGGPVRLYRNDGTGHFTEDTAAMPAIAIAWSWDLQLADVDGDWDLDVLVSCKLCATSYLFRNDGTGHFTNDPDALPHFRNNYAFAVMDLDGDGDLDLATINDGPDGTDHLFVNRGDGTFADETAARLTGGANPPEDDNAAVWLDVDDDGDADLLVASLSGPDRLLVNDGTGHFMLAPGAATPDDTPGSLGIAVADLDGDGRLDVVQAQGEVAFPEKVQLATSAVAIDTQPPAVQVAPVAGPGRVVARVHDHQSPSHVHDFQRVVLRYGRGHAAPVEVAMRWAGGYLWAADLPAGAGFDHAEVCATDRQGNAACAAASAPGGGDGAPPGDDAGAGGPGQSGGCCDAGGGPGSPAALALLVIALGLSCGEARTTDRGVGGGGRERRGGERRPPC